MKVNYDSLTINTKAINYPLRYDSEVKTIDILRDGDTVDVSVNVASVIMVEKDTGVQTCNGFSEILEEIAILTMKTFYS